jgi:cell division protein FtsZ
VLFNITGGYDMSMHEINEAAEVITNAVAPDANIIFGATLKPEMDDELIITVIATGFDSAYFREKAGAMAGAGVTAGAATTVHDDDDTEEPVKDEDIKKIDMDLDKDEEEHDFNKEDEPGHSIWNYDDESDVPSFLKRKKKKD